MKGKMILAITIAILALALTIWCFIDGTYYIGVFARKRPISRLDGDLI